MRTPSARFVAGGPPSPRAAAVAHSHFMRNARADFATCVENLAAWIKARGVRAFGVGSPWGPAQAAAMRRCEREDRDAYYAGRLTDDFLFRDEMEATLAALARACPDVTFFLDMGYRVPGLPYMENARVRALMDYLADGIFRNDWPGLQSGEVPVEAFRFADFREALATP